MVYSPTHILKFATAAPKFRRLQTPEALIMSLRPRSIELATL